MASNQRGTVATRGRFITVEGGEGVGKSVFMAGLAKTLRDAGVTLVTTREPGGTPAADKIRALFGTPPDGDELLIETEALLVSAARAQHVGRLIEPALARGDWVLCDRYHDSMRVYQGRLGGVSETFLEQLIAGSTKGLDPDVTFLLDCDVAVARARVERRGEHGEGAPKDAIKRYDEAKTTAHERLRQGFLALASRWPKRIEVIDASQAPEAVLAQATRRLKEKFGLG